jgi:hypothetical protein
VPRYGWACLPVPWCSWPESIFAKVIGRKKARHGGSLSDSCHPCGVAPCHWVVEIFLLWGWSPRTPFRVVSVIDHFPCYHASSGGSLLLSCRLSPHSWRALHRTIWVVERPRHLARHAFSRAQVLSHHFSFLSSCK